MYFREHNFYLNAPPLFVLPPFSPVAMCHPPASFQQAAAADSCSPTSAGGATVVMAVELPCSTNQKQQQAMAEESKAAAQEERYSGGQEVYMEEVRRMGGLALPIVWLGLAQYGRMAASVYNLGRLGRMELAGGSLAIGLANISCYSVLTGLAMGMEPICGQAYGAGKWAAMGDALQSTVLMLLVACLPIAALWLSMRPLLLMCGQDPQLASYASAYLLCSLPDLIAQSFLIPLRIYLRSQSALAPLTVSASLALCVHLPLTYALSRSRLRHRGVALAAAASNFLLLLFLLVYLRRQRRLPCFMRRPSSAHDRSGAASWKLLLSLALPSCASVCLEWWWYELMILSSAFLLRDAAAVAAMGILIQTTSLLYIFPSSLSLALSTRIAQELGAHRPVRARLAARLGLFCASALAVAAFAFSAAMRRRWALVFTPDPRIAALVAAAMPILGLCELGNCPQTAGCGVLRGSARPSAAANINLGSFYGVGLPVALFLGRRMGFVGLWLGLLAAQATCAALMLLVVGGTDWEVEAQKAKELTGSMGVAAIAEAEAEAHELDHLISIKVASIDVGS